MNLNGIQLVAYAASGDEAKFELKDTDVREVAALDGETLSVRDDEDALVETFVGYAVAAMKVEGDVVRMRATRSVDPQTAEAIAGLEAAIKEVAQDARSAREMAASAASDVSTYMDALAGSDDEEA